MCGLEFDRKDISMNKLVATSLEAKFHCYDMRTPHPTKGFASVAEKVCISRNVLVYVWCFTHFPDITLLECYHVAMVMNGIMIRFVTWGNLTVFEFQVNFVQ